MTSPAFAPPCSWQITRPRRRRQLIGLTPLIDVVFILLVFFMLASSFLDWRSITLSKPSADAAPAAMEGALLVEVRTQDVRLSGRRVALEDLTGRVRSRLADKADQSIVVKAAAGVPLQRAVAVLDSLAAAGATKLSLIRDRAR